MPEVYRMENRAHLGPFSAPRNATEAVAMWKNVPWMDATHDGYLAERPEDHFAHPHHLADVLGEDRLDTYMEDLLGINPIAGTWLVGCKDLPQFYHWFPPNALPDFAHCGMLMHIYECPEAAIKYGQWQLMFDPKRSKLVKSVALTKLKGTATRLAA